ncbi:hypothetical protein FAY30_26995 (plasmid) [Bacillus sp. S3]|uniref:hypothetical protein n=1 Tax=Bacillus sp. S3 TaxID=486398 RepID=UPI0011895E9B|nr:hypothetical protein [Bacillus sp. S3]QCJ45580.1 hypothetical protein FAY30_26995 [Bacillus sp. S3]
MMEFNQLSEQAKSKAIEGFVKAAKGFLSIQGINLDHAKEFLSHSKVHRYNSDGVLVGKIKGPKENRRFEPGNLY